MKHARVIILNGVSSVGKSSVAKAIQAIAARPFLYVAGDAFMRMLPATMMQHPDGVTIHQTPDGDLSIELGSQVTNLLSGMRRSIAAIAGQGNDVIVDDIMLSASD